MYVCDSAPVCVCLIASLSRRTNVNSRFVSPDISKVARVQSVTPGFFLCRLVRRHHCHTRLFLDTHTIPPAAGHDGSGVDDDGQSPAMASALCRVGAGQAWTHMGTIRGPRADNRHGATLREDRRKSELAQSQGSHAQIALRKYIDYTGLSLVPLPSQCCMPLYYR